MASSASPTTARFTDRGRRGTTFKDGLRAPIHRWFTITPAYAPQLVADCAAHLAVTPTDQVLDPFAGAGTTPTWCRLQAMSGTAVEWNPALALVSRVKATLQVAPATLQATGDRFATTWRAALPPPTAIARYLDEQAAWQPRIAFAERWWAPPALAALTAARRLLADWPDDECRPGLELALLRVLLPASRARYSHASVTFDPQAVAWPADMVVDAFQAHLAAMAADLASLVDHPQRPGIVLHGNSRHLERLLPEPGRYTLLICSPPYPNRYSYARETRPHLFFLDLVPDARAVGDLEVEAIGGTWGRATALLKQPHTPEPTVVAPLMAPLLPALRAAHPLMANYGVRYFNDLWQHLQSVSQVMARRARLAYVIGNSQLGGVPVPAAEWLVQLAAAAGWRPHGQGIYTLRRRNSRPGLVESVVFLER